MTGGIKEDLAKKYSFGEKLGSLNTSELSDYPPKKFQKWNCAWVFEGQRILLWFPNERRY